MSGNNLQEDDEIFVQDELTTDPDVARVVNEIVEQNRRQMMDSGLTRAQTIVVFRGVKMAAEFTEHSLLKQDGRDVTEGVARMDLDSVAGGPDVGRPSGPPTEADFDNIELGLDHDITPTKLRLMAVETAVDIQNSGLDITRNRQHGHRIMSSEAIVTAQMVFGKLLENAQKNIILVLENARAYDIALCGGERMNSDQDPKLMKSLEEGIANIIGMTECAPMKSIALNLTRIKVYTDYMRLKDELHPCRVTPFKEWLIREFERIQEKDRTRGQKNDTVAMTILAGHLGLTFNDIKKVIKDAKLSWMLFTRWGKGSIMFLPANKSGHSHLGHLSALDQVLDIAARHDNGIFARLASRLDSVIVDRISKGAMLGYSAPGTAQLRELKARPIFELLDYIAELDDGSSDESELSDSSLLSNSPLILSPIQHLPDLSTLFATSSSTKSPRHLGYPSPLITLPLLGDHLGADATRGSPLILYGAMSDTSSPPISQPPAAIPSIRQEQRSNNHGRTIIFTINCARRRGRPTKSDSLDADLAVHWVQRLRAELKHRRRQGSISPKDVVVIIFKRIEDTKRIYSGSRHLRLFHSLRLNATYYGERLPLNPHMCRLENLAGRGHKRDLSGYIRHCLITQQSVHEKGGKQDPSDVTFRVPKHTYRVILSHEVDFKQCYGGLDSVENLQYDGMMR
ncbi:hypothetical protein GQ607_017865 [Colletotrichum asianum]|uniref:Uncharacterized protein n=1 Tax=Colletotrichum asianum TaxID=702518 RepID=A0A8H3ZG55_9PEZI|nr:hypothetical protein GQ607_017865 [Colletotrichum asianum]